MGMNESLICLQQAACLGSEKGFFFPPCQPGSLSGRRVAVALLRAGLGPARLLLRRQSPGLLHHRRQRADEALLQRWESSVQTPALRGVGKGFRSALPTSRVPDSLERKLHWVEGPSPSNCRSKPEKSLGQERARAS